MKTDILEGNANDRPNYDVTWTINAAVITEITRQPRRPHHELISSRTGSTASHVVIKPVSYSWIPRSACFIMQDVHFEPFYRRYVYFGAGADGAVGG